MNEKQLNRILQEGDINAIEKELKSGLDVDFTFQELYANSDNNGYALLDVAVAARQKEVVQFLVDRGANVNRMRKWPGATKELINSFSLQNTCMYPCLVRGDVEIANILVKAGFDVNLQDIRQCSSLWHAADSGNCKLVDVILSSPTVNVNLPDMTFLHPLHVAALHGHSKIISSLLRKGANANAIHVFGNTPLILACKTNCYESVHQLLLYGADVNAANIYGVTPLSKFLHNPSTLQDLRIFGLLLKAGALVFDCELKEWKQQEDLQIFSDYPQIYETLILMSSSPSSLKTLTCKFIRFRVLQCLKDSPGDIFSKIDQLQLPSILKKELLLEF
ncbi:ankyrin repeat, PH and SEC7 domain containing protein secG-like [Saccostrea cucullata]|uniref:ankyrin repeat, PH and SEC7 domain containing protein secG-like n=1 Tax=Saccostrea cuccullata TaxID=36930 RepID=UPI002ED4C72D